MKSIAFPIMLGNSSTNIIKDHDATSSNLKLLLLSDKTSLFGDPYFGTNIKKLIHDQNNIVLRDLVIDDIYTAITTFMPQIIVKRGDIKVTSDRSNVYVNIKCLNLIDYTTDLYNINLTSDEEI
jgi:phage baseplate assembly protein W|nr:MAG TPA: baseplate wedge subunit [Caudoviricetes sp.]